MLLYSKFSLKFAIHASTMSKIEVKLIRVKEILDFQLRITSRRGGHMITRLLSKK